MDDPIFSVVICTHNRACYLERALVGVRAQKFPAERFEILVVDNASRDGTHEVVRSATHGGGVRYIFEPELGLSHARNIGWQEAKGEFVAYLDDDAIPGPEWLANAAKAFREGKPDIGMLGGKVEPIWEAPRPDWLDDNLLRFLSMVDLGPEPRYVDADWGIVGANMIIPRRLLEQVGGFSSRLGRKGGSLLSSEEILLKRQLAAAGYRGFYQPGVCVQHHAPSERLDRRWFLDRYYWQGRSNAALMDLEQPLPAAQRWLRLVIDMGKACLLYAGSLASGRFVWRARANGHLGLAVGLLRGFPASRPSEGLHTRSD